jgi:hypothetical protein
VAILTALAVSVAACGATKPKVYVQGVYKPTQIVLGANTPIRDIRWKTYGGAQALADGMFAVNDCTPNCASGHITWEPTRFFVSYVGPCKGKRSYRLISIPIRGVHDYALQEC